MTDDIRLRPLTTVQRGQAKERAVKATLREIGDKPTFAQFENTTIGKFPPELIQRVTRLAYGFLIAAFIPSAIRLFAIGYDTFYHSIESKALAVVVAACVVSLAEIGAILFTLAFAVLPVHRLTRALLVTAMLVSVSISLIGNYTFALHGQGVNLFAWLEALGPPTLTLITAYILKEVGLDSIKRRHADKVAYDNAVSEWQKQVDDIEQHKHYIYNLANSIWDAIVTKNRSLADGVEFDAETKSYYVRLELQQENWYQAVENNPSKRSSQNRQSNRLVVENGLVQTEQTIDTSTASSRSKNGLVKQIMSEHPELLSSQANVRDFAVIVSELAGVSINKDTANKARQEMIHAMSNGHNVE